MKRLQIQLKGIVQGVGFRYYTKRKADELQVNGFVMNESNGNVSIEAEGEEENIDEFLRWARQGPPRANVRHVKYEEIAPKGEDSFIVR